MPQDAFTLRHVARELDAALAGAKVNKIIQPSRDEVDLLVYDGSKTRKLILNTNASFARACLSEAPRRAPDVAPNFCMLLRKHLTGAALLGVRQIAFERILAFEFDCAGEFTRARRTLYAEIMGKYSNLILTEEGTVTGALKISSLQENFKRVLFPGVRYALPEPQDKTDPSDKAALASCLANLTGDAADYLFAHVAGLAYPTCRLLAAGAPHDRDLLTEYVYGFIFSDEKAPAVERINGEAKDFHVRFAAGERYASVNAAEDAYYTERETKRNFSEKKRKLENLLSSRKKKEEKKLGILLERERECDDMEKLRIRGELITANMHAIRKGADRCEASDYYQEGAPTVSIPLDKNLTPSQNAQKYFKKYAKQKRTLAAIAPQKAEAKADLDYTESALSSLARAENILDLTEIEEEVRAAGLLPPDPKKKKAEAPVPFRTFAVEGFTISAGRNNVQNDRLLRAARPDDIWMHAQKYHSAHVVVRTEGKKVPDSVLLAAAQICAYFSDGKAGDKIPVDYCERRFVKKPPKAKAGFVLYTDFRTLLVTPDRRERDETRPQ